MGMGESNAVVVQPKRSRNNPYKVNQYTAPDPRQALFLERYLNPKSATFSNALQSALAVGYSQDYAKSLTSDLPVWLSENLGDNTMLQKAVRNLDEFLDMDPKVQAMGAFGPIFEKRETFKEIKLKNGKTKKKKMVEKVPIMVTNAKLAALKQDTSKFVAERIGKSRFGKDGEGGGLTQNNYYFISDEQRKRIARRVVARNQSGEGNAG